MESFFWILAIIVGVVVLIVTVLTSVNAYSNKFTTGFMEKFFFKDREEDKIHQGDKKIPDDDQKNLY